MSTITGGGESRLKVYEPTATGFPKVRDYVRDIWQRRALIWHLTRTDLKSDNYDTVLGQIWLVLDPLLLAAVYYFIRTIIRPVGEEDRGDFIAHIIIAIFFFQLASHMVGAGSKALTTNSRFILNTGLPRLVYPLMSVAKATADFVPTLIVYFAVHAMLGQEWSWTLAFLPVIAALLVVFEIGGTLLFSTLTVFYRDMSNLLSYVTRMWLFATPILYRVSEIPENMRPYLKLNPLYPFFVMIDQVTNATLPGLGYVLAALAWTAVAMLVGSAYFLWREHDVPVRL